MVVEESLCDAAIFFSETDIIHNFLKAIFRYPKIPTGLSFYLEVKASWPSARPGGFPKGNGAGWRWGIFINWTDISGKVIDNMILRQENKKDGQVKMDH